MSRLFLRPSRQRSRWRFIYTLVTVALISLCSSGQQIQAQMFDSGSTGADGALNLTTPGDLVGPYLSQLLWLDVPVGTLTAVQRNRVPDKGADLTVGGELNKLASNIALGRDTAGVHWRSDSIEGLKLGEAVAIGILTDLRTTCPESFDGFSFTRFDGTTLRI